MIERANLLIGLDDTDVAGTPGTGNLARRLTAELDADLPVRRVGVSRHQHLVDERIRYTSRNSSACIGLVDDGLDLAVVVDRCVAFLRRHFQPGSDPGLCVARPEQLDEGVLAFARRTQQEVVEAAEALDLARTRRLALSEHGGDGGGVIGALSATALRASGDDGRFVDLTGIRDVVGRCQVADIIAPTPVVRVETADGQVLDDDQWVQTQDWIRPDLVGHQPVVRVRRNGPNGWITVKPHKSKKST